MAYWLYQMNAKQVYSHERYRTEVWEGSEVQNWKLGESKHRPKELSPGDIIILFYVKSYATDRPGIYGWGIVTFFDKKREEMNFRPSSPSDYLKMNPLPENKLSKIIKDIRGDFPEGTVWQMNQKQLELLREKIAEHVYGVTP